MLLVVRPDAGGRVEMMLVALVILVCGLAVLLYVMTTRRSMPPLEPEQEQRNIAT